MTDKQIDINNQVEVGLNIAKELLELHKMFEDEVEKSPYFIQTNFIKNKLFYFYQRADWLNVCFNLLDKQLQAKEQECEELKKIIDEAKNSKLDLKSFLVSEAIQNEYEEQLDQLKEEHYALKVMFKDLSYENQKFSYQIEEQTKQLEPFKDEYFKGLETIVIAELAKKSIRITAENRKLEQTLTEIKEIAEHCITQDICTTCDNSDKCHIEDEEIPTYDVCKLILQKISECEGNDE